MLTTHDIDIMVMSYLQNKTQEGLGWIVHALLNTDNNRTLFDMAASQNPAVRLAVAEALLWSREPGRTEKGRAFDRKGRCYPLFTRFSENQGDRKTTTDIATVIVMYAATQPDRFDEIRAIIQTYKRKCGFYVEGADSEYNIYRPLLELEMFGNPVEHTLPTSEPVT